MAVSGLRMMGLVLSMKVEREMGIGAYFVIYVLLCWRIDGKITRILDFITKDLLFGHKSIIFAISTKGKTIHSNRFALFFDEMGDFLRRKPFFRPTLGGKNPSLGVSLNGATGQSGQVCLLNFL